MGNANMEIDAIAQMLVNGRAATLRYIRSKVADPDAAEDILQDSLVKVLRTLPDLRDEERLIPWFHRIINNAIIDYYRHKAVEGKHLERGREDLDDMRQSTEVPPDEKGMICACIADIIPTLRPEQAEVIRLLELEDGDPEFVAAQLGITRNNLKVRRHRARTQLRERLQETCRTCAQHGCLDCSCRRA
ncbi:MAG: sigma-70 family RNA polymerase sigma factor [Chlorobi bacterium CHB2]|nr:sigma-70 family RNA polymerase sigma factor [Chlorobi bacterium CHB2]